MIEKRVGNKKRGDKTYLLKDKEAYIMATLEIDGAQGLPRDIQIFTEELQQVIHDVGGRIVVNCIKPSPAKMYSRGLIQCVNINEEGAEGKKQITRTGMIKVLGVSQKRGK